LRGRGEASTRMWAKGYRNFKVPCAALASPFLNVITPRVREQYGRHPDCEHCSA
jgi:hypothetical protein